MNTIISKKKKLLMNNPSKNGIIKDSAILITDEVMRDVYVAPCIDEKSVRLIDFKTIRECNLYCPVTAVLKVSRLFDGFPILIGGSSNYHHFVIAHIKSLISQTHTPLQLVLIDRHMDCQKYNETSGTIHCGNWVSYCHRNKLVSHVYMIGCQSEIRQSSFDHTVSNSGTMYHVSEVMNIPGDAIFEPNYPMYIAIDTDILDQPNDWGKGNVPVIEFLNMPLWEMLTNKKIIGGSIFGHVTDNRKCLDLLKKVFENPVTLFKNIPADELVNDILTTVLPKAYASLSSKPLPLDIQLQIIKLIYFKLQAVITKTTALTKN